MYDARGGNGRGAGVVRARADATRQRKRLVNIIMLALYVTCDGPFKNGTRTELENDTHIIGFWIFPIKKKVIKILNTLQFNYTVQ